MKNKKFTLGILLVIGIGLTALPMAAAQDFGGGDAGSNEDEGTTGDFGGGDAGSNEDEGTTDDSDGDFGGGDAGSNEDESDFGGGDSDNNEDETGEDPEDTEEEETEDDVAEPQTDGAIHVITARPPSDLQAELSSDTVSVNEQVTVSGQLAIDENANRTINILLNGTEQTSVTTNGDGSFQGTFTPTEAGSYTVELELEDEELTRELDLQVTGGAIIDSLTTSGETRAGQTIEVCAEMASSEEVEVTLHHNDQEVNTLTGQDRICFNPVLESGTNTFRVVATSNGESDQAIISRNTGTAGPGNGTGDPGTGTPTGGFLGSPTARIAAVGTLLVAAALAVILFARRRGALQTP